MSGWMPFDAKLHMTSEEPLAKAERLEAEARAIRRAVAEQTRRAAEERSEEVRQLERQRKVQWFLGVNAWSEVSEERWQWGARQVERVAQGLPVEPFEETHSSGPETVTNDTKESK